MQGLSWAEVGLIPRAEGAMEDFDQGVVRPELLTASAGRLKGSVGHGDGQRLGGTSYSLSSQPSALDISWAAERPRISGLEGSSCG